MKPKLDRDQMEELFDDIERSNKMLGICSVVGFLVIIGLIVYGLLGAKANAGEIILTWDPPPPEEKVVAWKVSRGIETFPAVTSQQIRISIPDDQHSVLTVRAENQFGDHSPPASIEVLPVIIESSTDLKTWTRLRVIYRARKPAEFFRIRLQP